MSRSSAACVTTRFDSARPRGPAELYERPHWFACHTRARAEKKVDGLLRRAGLEAFVPLIERERQWADRKKRVKFPLFPGYVFACFDLRRMAEVLRLPSLVTVVGLNGYPTPVREEELESVRALVDAANRAGVEPHPSDYLVPGQRVEVVEGPFRGLSGILVERRAQARVAVRLSAIRQAVSVELERRHVRPVSR